ncbi:hypothetical protein [Motiliproteus sp. SC1-56]|uniref:hypothetical protein n=1 Tax=Motiliproteus sp. SC1-56 TaxID=2799565 RepID=UPI001A9070FC|nr:hypothetical protein [Motiliproteus sp. SC1-56]
MIEPAQQHEQLRQQYLAAMGITSWLPVRPLPGAAASPAWEWLSAAPAVQQPLPESTPAAAAAPAVDSPRPAASRVGTKPDLKQLLDVSGLRAEKPAPSPSPASPPVTPSAPVSSPESEPEGTVQKAAGEVPRFRLAMIRYEDCLVVDELPLQSLQGFSAAHRTLLGRILASVGLGQGEPQVQAFTWPLVNAAHVDQSEAVARGGLRTRLWRMQQGGALPLLLLGQQAARYTLAPDEATSPGSWSESGEAPWTLVSHSLGELLKVPGRKRELWQHLLPLRNR